MFPKKYLPEDKIRQKICQSSPELRALAAKLDQAYINKERAAQVAEKNLQRKEDEYAKAKAQEDLMEEKRYLKDLEKKELLDDQLSKLRYQKQLDDQLQMMEQERGKVFKQFMIEKEQIDEVVRKIRRENEEATIKKMEKKMATNQQIEEFKSSQQVWREIEENRIREENEQIGKFVEYKDHRDEEIKRQTKDRRQLKNESVIRLAEDMQKQQDIKREHEDILFELNEGRKLEEDNFKDQLEMENNIKKRMYLREANELASKYKKQREEKEKAEEEKYKQMMLEKFANDDKLEQMNAQRRRMKKEEHKRAVQHLLEERKMKREAEKGQDVEQSKEKEREEEETQKIIEEERMRLLQQNIDRLVGHIPKGVLSQVDIDALGGKLKTIYKKESPADPLEELEKKYSQF